MRLGLGIWHARIAVLYAAAWLWRRLLLRTTFVGITGSVGKTTAKECLAVALSSRYSTAKTYANQNDFSGVPLSLLRVRPWHRFAVLELAGNGCGLMNRSARLVRPDVAVVLSVARTHMKEHRTLDAVAAEKERLLAALRPDGIAVLNGDDPRVAAMAARVKQRIVWFGSAAGFEYRCSGVTACWPERLAFDIQAGAERGRVQTRLVGAHWSGSVLAAVATAHLLGISLADAITAIGRVEPTPGRMQPAAVPCGAIVLRDEFNGSVDTLHCAIAALAGASAGRRILVMTDVSDSTQRPRDRLRAIGREVARIFDAAVFIGPRARHGVRGALEGGMKPEDAHEFVSAEAAEAFLKADLRKSDVVLLRGRASDHLSRLFFGLRGNVACRKVRCERMILCDFCPELGTDRL